ncbi:hypothetical protein KIN20_016392 [Parelaphostrongylus tenuis]|uniref:Receptor ligand binding region domain-containing protein n=1 Tax=Parelaphostrongylus tenuis TaxID=148309 RepID=A0AAD5MGD4_PARTN|nr:hypothetical protein KIN20_016392 [Parelaphostrongylus tenuis]
MTKPHGGMPSRRCNKLTFSTSRCNTLQNYRRDLDEPYRSPIGDINEMDKIPQAGVELARKEVSEFEGNGCEKANQVEKVLVCEQDTCDDAFSETNDIIITLNIEIKKIVPNDITEALKQVTLQARIVVVCLAEGYGNKRMFILTAKDAGFLNKEYVYLFADTKSKGFSVPLAGGKQRLIWKDIKTPKDGRDEEAMMAFAQTLIISDVSKPKN